MLLSLWIWCSFNAHICHHYLPYMACVFHHCSYVTLLFCPLSLGIIHRLRNTSRGQGVPWSTKCYGKDRGGRGLGVYIVPLRSARELSGQPFVAMNKRFFRLEQALLLAKTCTRAFMQIHACFFNQSASSFIYHSNIWWGNFVRTGASNG